MAGLKPAIRFSKPMKRLILLRHAKTEPWHEGVDDHGRALIERGRADAVRVGEALAAAGWTPDLALVSTARRARETWAGLEPAFSECQRRLSEDLYLTGVHGLAEAVAENDAVGSLMLVGHNPGLHDFAIEIVRRSGSLDHQAARRISAKMPTACAAVFEAAEPGRFTPAAFPLAGVIVARDLRPEGGG